VGRSGGPCSPARHERAERRGVLRAGVVSVSSFQRWKALAAPAGAAAQAQTPVPQAAFVDLGGARLGRGLAPGTQAGSGRQPRAPSGAWLMFFPEGTVRVHLYGRPVDMRKSLNGLHAFARHGVGQDPLSGLPARCAAERHLEPDSA
jgi:hypothetical protein